MFMKALAVGAMSVLMAIMVGCASQPDQMDKQYVSPIQYQALECAQISLEMERTSRRINELYTSLKKAADNDATQMGVGLILFWPTLFFLEGGDGPQAAEYSRLKGGYEALESVAIEKKCSVPTTAKIARWSVHADSTVKESCTTPGPGTLIAATGNQEDYQFPCAGEAPLLVRCEPDGCRGLK
jgi:hypothetical protein